jgi:CheY-like chemotaxis protein
MPEFDLVLMDIMMPGMDGYETMRAIRAIDQFASLPIIAVTAIVTSTERQRCLEAGANDYVPKPVDTKELLAALTPWLPATLAAQTATGTATPSRQIVGTPVDNPIPNGSGDGAGLIEGLRILVVDDDFRNIFAMTALLERNLADVTVVESGPEALAVMDLAPDFDVVLMDIMMPGMDGYETIREIRKIDRFRSLPIIAVTAKLTAGERERCLEAGATDYVPKPVNSTELLAALRPSLTAALAIDLGAPVPALTLLDSVVIDKTVRSEPSVTSQPRRAQIDPSPIRGLKVLVVDDDFRNIFAMSALLERGEAEVTLVESGADALAALERVPDIDVVLMDVMMPVMDGYATMRAIRAIDRFAELPIIAVTGKTTPGERERCIDAGANDYVPKLLDTVALLEALKPWLPSRMSSAS